MPDDQQKQYVEPLWSRRARAQKTAADAAFTEMRTKDGRSSPQAWINPVKPNTTQSQKEKPAAGHMVKGRPSQLRYRMASTGTGVRASVPMKRAVGVTAEDRNQSGGGDNAEFFSEAAEQKAIEKARAGK